VTFETSLILVRFSVQDVSPEIEDVLKKAIARGLDDVQAENVVVSSVTPLVSGGGSSSSSSRVVVIEFTITSLSLFIEDKTDDGSGGEIDEAAYFYDQASDIFDVLSSELAAFVNSGLLELMIYEVAIEDGLNFTDGMFAVDKEAFVPPLSFAAQSILVEVGDSSSEIIGSGDGENEVEDLDEDSLYGAGRAAIKIQATYVIVLLPLFLLLLL
jgi:hypothetical protein